jgi:hypothetical protein
MKLACCKKKKKKKKTLTENHLNVRTDQVKGLNHTYPMNI